MSAQAVVLAEATTVKPGPSPCVRRLQSLIVRAADDDDDDHIVNMLLNVHRNHKTYWGRGYGGGGSIYLSLQCHHRNDFCIKMGSDESHLNVSVIVRDKVTKQCPQTTTVEEKGEPKRIRTEVLLLASLTSYR